MSYNIDQVNGAESSQAQIDEARRQANAAIDVIAKTEAVVEGQKRENAGREVDHKRNVASYEAEAAKEDTAEATVASEMATQGMPAAVQLISTGAQMLSGARSNPAHMDPKKLSKMTGGTVTSATTMEDMASSMLGSFIGEPESKGAELMARSNAQEDFTRGRAPTGMAVQPDAINVSFVKSLTQDLAQKAHYDQTLANVARAEQQLNATNRAAPQNAMGGPGMGMAHNGYASGPKGPTIQDEEMVG